MNFSTLCTLLVTFGLETPEFTLLTIVCGDTAKIGISCQISQNVLDLGVLVGYDFPNIRLAVA